MSVTYYKNKHFNGVFGKIGPGYYYGQGLAGCGNMSSQCEDLSRNISSLRIDENIIVALGDSVTARAGVRVLMGPMEIPDVSAIKMEGKVVSVYVAEYSPDVLSNVGATIFNNGRNAFLSRGDYNSNRLASEEVKIPADKITSISVMPNSIVVLSASEVFKPDALSVMLVGPTEANLDSSAFSTIYGKIRAIRVISGRQPLPMNVNVNFRPEVAITADVYPTKVFVAQQHYAQPHVAQPHVAQQHVAQQHYSQPHVAQQHNARPNSDQILLIIIILLLVGCCMTSDGKRNFSKVPSRQKKL